MRRYPEGESAPTWWGFTSQEDQGLEGIELSFQRDLLGQGWLTPGDQGPAGPRWKTWASRAGAAWQGHRARHGQQGAVLSPSRRSRRGRSAQRQGWRRWWYGRHTGELLALANYPSYGPTFTPAPHWRAAAQPRAHRRFEPSFDDEAVHHWPGRRPAAKARNHHPTAPGRINITGSTITTRTRMATLTVERHPEVQQRRHRAHGDGHERERAWEPLAGTSASGKAADQLPGVATGRLRNHKDLASHRAGHHELWLWPVRFRCQMPRLHGLARDGEIIPITMLKRHEPVMGGQRIVSATRRQGAPHAADGGGRGRHGPPGPRPKVIGGRQVGHGPQAGRRVHAEKKYRAGSWAWRPSTSPGSSSADGRRTQQWTVFRRAGGSPGVPRWCNKRCG